MATEEKRMSAELKPEPAADFVADFREGEARAREWIVGRSDLPDLLHVVRDMPRGGAMSGVEAGFLSTIDAAVRGDRRSEAGAPDPARARLLLKGPPASGATEVPPIDVDEFRRRRREREMAARLQELGRRNAEAWQEQSAFITGDHRRKDADWRGV
jgi:hypothetical protein